MADHFSPIKQGSLTVPGQRSPPPLSVSSRSEQVSTLCNNVRFLVAVLTVIFCTYKPCEKVTFSHDWVAHPVLKEGGAQRIV